jgi:prepilin peptidase CpaA
MTSAVFAPSVAAVAVAILIAATLHDIAFRTVPNWMPLLLAAAGLLRHAMQGNPVFPAITGVLATLAAALCWHRGWLGGGDVKLLGAAAVLVPPALAPRLLGDVALAGGVLALLYLALSRLVPPPPATRPEGLRARIWRAERWRIRRRGPLPYASAIAAGALFVLLKG